jgi:hypothetical protein
MLNIHTLTYKCTCTRSVAHLMHANRNESPRQHCQGVLAVGSRGRRRSAVRLLAASREALLLRRSPTHFPMCMYLPSCSDVSKCARPCSVPGLWAAPPFVMSLRKQPCMCTCVYDHTSGRIRVSESAWLDGPSGIALCVPFCPGGHLLVPRRRFTVYAGSWPSVLHGHVHTPACTH